MLCVEVDIFALEVGKGVLDHSAESFAGVALLEGGPEVSIWYSSGMGRWGKERGEEWLVTGNQKREKSTTARAFKKKKRN